MASLFGRPGGASSPAPRASRRVRVRARGHAERAAVGTNGRDPRAGRRGAGRARCRRRGDRAAHDRDRRDEAGTSTTSDAVPRRSGPVVEGGNFRSRPRSSRASSATLPKSSTTSSTTDARPCGPVSACGRWPTSNCRGRSRAAVRELTEAAGPAAPSADATSPGTRTPPTASDRRIDRCRRRRRRRGPRPAPSDPEPPAGRARPVVAGHLLAAGVSATGP